MVPEIIYEDENILAVNKPAGLLVHHPAHRKNGEESLTDWLMENYPQIKSVGDDPQTRPGIVHRLDKNTSGVMVVSKTQEYFGYLKGLFQSRAMKKDYVAIVHGWPKKDKFIVDRPIGIRHGTLKRSVHSSKMAKEAVTEFEVLERSQAGDSKISLIKAVPRTGRTHQVRLHLASEGFPVAGDDLYGPKKKRIFGRLMLHAWKLEFTMKNGARIMLEAPIPGDFDIHS